MPVDTARWRELAWAVGRDVPATKYVGELRQALLEASAEVDRFCALRAVVEDVAEATACADDCMIRGLAHDARRALATDCEHEGTDDFVEGCTSYTCKDCGAIFEVCPGCSAAGGAGLPVYHMPPLCTQGEP